MRVFYKTYQNESSSIHLEGISDTTLCGVDISGDTLVHERPPEEIHKKCIVTCKHCRQMIDIVKDYING